MFIVTGWNTQRVLWPCLWSFFPHFIKYLPVWICQHLSDRSQTTHWMNFNSLLAGDTVEGWLLVLPYTWEINGSNLSSYGKSLFEEFLAHIKCGILSIFILQWASFKFPNSGELTACTHCFSCCYWCPPYTVNNKGQSSPAETVPGENERIQQCSWVSPQDCTGNEIQHRQFPERERPIDQSEPGSDDKAVPHKSVWKSYITTLCFCAARSMYLLHFTFSDL